MPIDIFLPAVMAASFSLQPVPDQALAHHLRCTISASGATASEEGPLEGPLADLTCAPWRTNWQSDGATELEEGAPNDAFGAQGTLRWMITGGIGAQVTEVRNKEAFLGLGLEYFLVEGFSFAPEVRLWGFFQTGEDAMGGSLDLLFRWHLVRRDHWSFFTDFGCGMLGSNHDVPIDGSRFNFTPQAGFGFTFDVGEGRRAIIGARWHHISNASLFRTNPGRDNVVVWGGLSLPF